MTAMQYSRAYRGGVYSRQGKLGKGIVRLRVLHKDILQQAILRQGILGQGILRVYYGNRDFVTTSD